MERTVLSDAQWERLAPLLPGKPGDPGRHARDNRLFLEAVLWIARTGASWRDLPESFGHWNSVFQRFRRWAKKGVFEQVFKVLSEDADFRVCAYRRHHRVCPPAWNGGKKGTPRPSVVGAAG